MFIAITVIAAIVIAAFLLHLGDDAAVVTIVGFCTIVVAVFGFIVITELYYAIAS